MADIIIGGIYNGPGVNASVVSNTPQTLNMTDTAEYAPNYKVSKLSVWVNSFSSPGASMGFNIYDVSDGADGADPLYEVVFVVPAGLVANGYVDMALDSPLPGLSGGEVLAIGRTSKITAGTFSMKAAVGVSSVAAAGITGPNPWVEIGTTPELWDAHFTLTPSALPPAVASVNGADPVVIGGGIAAVTSNLSAVGMTVGGLPVNNFEAVDADNYTATMPGFSDSTVYPFPGTVSVVMFDSADPPNAPSLDKTLALPAGFSSVTYATLSTDSDCLAERIEGAIIEPGDFHYYPIAQITIYDDSTFADAPTGTVETWLHKAATGLLVQVLIINGFPFVPGGRGILPQPIAALPILPLPITPEPI